MATVETGLCGLAAFAVHWRAMGRVWENEWGPGIPPGPFLGRPSHPGFKNSGLKAAAAAEVTAAVAPSRGQRQLSEARGNSTIAGTPNFSGHFPSWMEMYGLRPLSSLSTSTSP